MVEREEATRILQGDFGLAVRNLTGSFVAPLFWQKLDDRGEVALRNGTAFFLDAGEGVMMATARHVYEGYLDALRSYPQAICQLGDLPFDPAERLIDLGADPTIYPDVATFRIAEEEIRAIGKTFITGPQLRWPPPPPERNAGVSFVGFPGVERRFMSKFDIEFGMFVGFLTISDLSDRDVVCAVEVEHLIDNPHYEKIAALSYDVRGISGAPLLVHIDRAGLSTFQLAGVIYQGVNGIIFAARADYILPDGRIRPFE